MSHFLLNSTFLSHSKPHTYLHSGIWRILQALLLCRRCILALKLYSQSHKGAEPRAEPVLPSSGAPLFPFSPSSRKMLRNWYTVKTQTLCSNCWGNLQQSLELLADAFLRVPWACFNHLICAEYGWERQAAPQKLCVLTELHEVSFRQ